MKKNCLLVIVTSLMFVMFGCMGMRGASVGVDENNGNIKKWSDHNISLFQPSISPTEIGRANVLNSQADLNRALAAQIRNNKNAEMAQYVGALINNDPRGYVYVHHPSMNVVIRIEPNGFRFIYTPEIPEYIYTRYDDDDEFDRNRVYTDTKFYNGAKIDFGARIEND